MTVILALIAIAGCLVATYGCLRLGVWIVFWRFKPPPCSR